MMCMNCKQAGDLNSQDAPVVAVASLHDACEFPASCTCQHATTRQWVTR